MPSRQGRGQSPSHGAMGEDMLGKKVDAWDAGHTKREGSLTSAGSSIGGTKEDAVEEQVPIAEMTLFGWGLPSLYCTMILILFPIPYFYLLFYVESDPGALVIDGRELPWRTIFMTKTAFGTGLLLDFVTWLWTVDSNKAKLFIFPAVINFLAYCSYEALSNGYAPILLDFRGRRIMTLRYVQWTFTTPTMLYLYSIVSSISRRELVKAMLMDIVMIISGFLASWLNPSINMIALAVSFACFYFVIHAINNMLTIAIDDCAPEDEKYRNALVWARLFMTLTWAAIPVVWCSAALDLISVTTEENLYQFFDFSSKAGVSCMLLHSSMQTYAQKQADKAMQSLQQERQNTIIAMQEASRQKERFFAAISHELRTPLNGIIGLADGIMAGSCGEMNSKVLQRLQTIKVSGQRLCVLVNDILDASSLKTETLRLCEDSLVLSEVCGHVIELTTPLVKKGVELKYAIADDLPPIRADAARIKQILHNVLGNATKFTDSGMVSLSVYLDDKGENCVFKVSDTGPGIPSDQIDRIWGAFNQGDEGLARKYGGTGLGLTIAKQLVEAHGGTIKCESAVGVGTTFKILIPTRRGGNALKDWQQSRVRDKEPASPDAAADHERRPSPIVHMRDAAKVLRDNSPMRRLAMEDGETRSISRRGSMRGSPLRGLSPGGSPRSQRAGTSAEWMRGSGEASPYSVSKRRSLTGLLPNSLLASSRSGEGGSERSANSPFDHSVVLPKVRDPTTGRSSSMTGLDSRGLGELASDRGLGGGGGLQGAFVHDLDDHWKSLESPEDDGGDVDQLKSVSGYGLDDNGLATPVSVGSMGFGGLLSRGSYRAVSRTKSADEWQDAKKVLMAGGTTDQCLVLDAMLSADGYRLVRAANREGAIDIMQEHDHGIDCILIDLPDAMTLELCKDLRRLFPGHVPIIIISEKPDDDSVIKCFDLGASDFMKKPYNKAEVLSRVQTHIKLRDLALRRRKASDDALGNIHPAAPLSSKRGIYSNELRSFEHQVLMDDLRHREAKLVDLEARLEEQRTKIETREKELKLDAKAFEEKMMQLKERERVTHRTSRGMSSAASVDMVLGDNVALQRLQTFFTSPCIAQAHAPTSGSPYGARSVRSSGGALEARRDSGGLDMSQLLIAFEAAKADCIMYGAALKEAETRARKLRHETSLMGAEAMEMVFRGQDLNWLDRQSLASYMLTDLQLWLLHKLGGSTGTFPELSNKTEVGILLRHLGLEHYSIHFDTEEVFSFKDLLRMGEGFLEQAGVHTRMSRKRIFSGARILREAADLAMAGTVAAKSPISPQRDPLSAPLNVAHLRTPSGVSHGTVGSAAYHYSAPGALGEHRKSSGGVFSDSQPSSLVSPKVPQIRTQDPHGMDSPLSLFKKHEHLPSALTPNAVLQRPEGATRQPSIEIMRLASYPTSEQDSQPSRTTSTSHPSRTASMEEKTTSIEEKPIDGHGANGAKANGSIPANTPPPESQVGKVEESQGARNNDEGVLKMASFELPIEAGMDLTAKTPRRSSLQPIIQEPPGSPNSADAGEGAKEPIKWDA